MRDRVIGPSIPMDHGFTCTRTRGSPATSPEGASEDGAIIRKSSRHRITGPCPLLRHSPTRRFYPYTGACGAKKRISIGSGNLRKYSLACNRRVSQEKSTRKERKKEGGRKENDRWAAVNTSKFAEIIRLINSLLSRNETSYEESVNYLSEELSKI